MPKIHFISSPKIPHDKVKEWAGYLVGTIHEVSNDEAERWLRRGNAEIVTTRQANLILKEEKKEEEKIIEEVKEEIKEEVVVEAKEARETEIEENQEEKKDDPIEVIPPKVAIFLGLSRGDKIV